MAFLKLMKGTGYALHIIYYMAQHSNFNPIQLKTISEALDLPENYMSKVLQTLNKANIINSFRGSKRGYRLAKKPEDITLLEIIEIFEGPVNNISCLLDSDNCIFGECIFKKTIDDLSACASSTLSKISIKDLVSNQEKKR